MSRIRSKDTKPEKVVRSLLHAAGFRFRLHRKDLPGTPDIVLPGHRAVIEVHGCYWHGHDCHMYRLSKSNSDFWRAKYHENRARDRRNAEALENLGWRRLVVWQCAIDGKDRLGSGRLNSELASWILSGDRTGEIRGA